MTHPSSQNPSDSLDLDALEGDRINTLMDNLNNLKSKLNNFTVMDELGQPIGEIQDLILDDTHQLNLVIATLDAAANTPFVLLNGRRIKKVSVQTHAVFVDIVKADVDFLPKYTPLSAPLPAEPPLPYSAAAALIGGGAIAHQAPENNLSPEDDSFPSEPLIPESNDGFAALEDSFVSDPLLDETTNNFDGLEENFFTPDSLFAEPADDFAALEDDLLTSELFVEPTSDFAASAEVASMESLDEDWFGDDEDDLTNSLGLPEPSELELSPLENLSLNSELTLDAIADDDSEDWSDLVSPTDEPSADYNLPAEASSVPNLASNDLLENPFSLAEAAEISEPEFASWQQASQPIDSPSSSTLEPLSDTETASELEDFLGLNSLENNFSADTPNENTEEFLMLSDLGEAESTDGFTLESLSDVDSPLEMPLDDFGFSDTPTADDDFAPLPDLNLNLGEGFVETDSDLSWAEEVETDGLFELNLDDSFNQPQAEANSELESELAEELADLDLSVIEATDLEFDSDLEFETDLNLEPKAIAPLPLDFSLDEDLLDSVEPSAPISAPIIDSSVSEIPTSFVEVPIDAIAVSGSDNLALELNTAFDVDLSLEDELGSAGFAIAEASDLSEFTPGSGRVELEPETITSLTDLEFTDAPLDNLPPDDLPTDDLTEMFGSVADLSFVEEGEFEDLSDLRSESVRDIALDSLFANPVDNLESASDEFNFSTPTMGFIDPAAGMAAASGILAGLAGLTTAGRSPTPQALPIEEIPVDIAGFSDLSGVSAQADLSLDAPAFSISDASESDVSESGIPESDISEAAPIPLLIPPNSEPILASLDDMVPLLEERLQVEYERRKVGEVIIRKKIETRMVQVPVRYEVLVIEQVSPAQKTLAEVDLSQGTFSEAEMPALAGKPTVSGEFKSAKTASAVIDAIAKTLRHQCKSIRIEIELDDSSLTQSYQDWLDRCSDL